MDNFSILPKFNFVEFFTSPWEDPSTQMYFFWMALMGFFVCGACGLIGNYLILRRMSLVGDAISHSVLPGIAIAFLLSHGRDPWWMFLGALGAGVLTTIIIEFIYSKSKIKQDAAIGITFSTFFAIGVILITAFADHVDLDADCVLHGDIISVPQRDKLILWGMETAPIPIVIMGSVFLLTLFLIVLFYKELLVSSFDSGLAKALGLNPRIIHYCLMCMLSIIVVSAFESVGAILVVAMLILPGSTAYLLTSRLPVMLILTIFQALISSILGLHLGLWLECSAAAAMVLISTLFFTISWLYVLCSKKLIKIQLA